MTGPSYVHVTGTLMLSERENVWRDKDGVVRAVVDLGACDLTFGSSEEARAVAAQILKAADAMDALPAGGHS